MYSLAKEHLPNSRLRLYMFSPACWEYHTWYVGGDLWLSEVRELRRLKTKARRKPDLIISLSRNLFFTVCMHRDLKFMLFKNMQHSFVLALFCM